MRSSFSSLVWLSGIVLTCSLFGLAMASPETPPAASHAPVDFDRDVRPILSENCFACHGFDEKKRQANLRLDIAEGAFKKLDSGHTAVVPGKPAASELYKRVSAASPMQMPPAYSGKKPLTPTQIATLRAWIEQGGKYAPHWAFVPPKRPALPAVRMRSWCINPIDYFVLAKLEQNGLKPSPVADRRTLIRRLTFDLTGLPPTPAEVDAFLNDKKPGAYERVVDRLLASPHYGERMALPWLDLAHYADTHGYHIDSARDMYRWRDWVIDAYNRNLPYDQFVIQQLAGDMLPNATLDQKIATGFCRNHPIDFEGGAIPEEYAAAYIFDRIDTTATTFMGLTMRCAQCHDHKYDPLTQKDFYRFFAFFNNIPEQGLDGQKGNAVPFIKAPLPGQQEKLDDFDRKIAELDKQMKARAAEAAPALAAWETNTAPNLLKTGAISEGLAADFPLDEAKGEQVSDSLGKIPAGTIKGKADWAEGKIGKALQFDGMTYVDLGDNFNFDRTDKASYGAWVYPTSGEPGTVVSRMDEKNGFRGWDIYLSDGRVYAHLIHKWEENAIRVNTKNQIELNKWHNVFVTYDGSSKAKGVHIYVDGKSAELDVTHDKLSDTIHNDAPLTIGRRTPGAPFKGRIDEVRLYNRDLTPAEIGQLYQFDSVRPVLSIAADKRTAEQKAALASFYLENNDEAYRKLSVEIGDQRKQRTDFDNTIPTVMVMEEMPKPRDTFLLVRGQYDQKGEKLTPDVPAVLPPLPKDAPHNRLSLARWLVDPSHPLTARVAVNRYWQMYFGTGLVKTAENFGTQGERPSHPELLDWLATEFMNPGHRVVGSLGRWEPNHPTTQSPNDPKPWDIKAIQRLIVTSATYRQSSRVAPELLEKDPENRLLTRGPRFRLPAEFVRDQALAISGLLVDKIGGPSVKPYQPAGLWEEISFKGGFSAQFYEQDHGENLYRRSMYTFWKRTCPPPALQAFDAPEREFCIVRRSVTNTPLQSLVVMNDPTYVEASRKLAERMMTECSGGPVDRVNFAFSLATARLPNDAERRVLLSAYREELDKYRADNAAALKLLSVGESKRNEKLDVAELAAWTDVANMILNLDETMTKG